MNEMTMGQRIAMQRKLKNLSQEALAEKLEVSRQAISKWESDGAIPEVDKLIALGKIYGVSVGWLLGTEAEGVCPPEPGFSDGQLQIIGELLAEATKPAPKKGRRAGWIVAGLLCLVLVGLCWWFSGWMDRQEAQVFAMTGQLAQMQEQITQLDAAMAENSGKVEILTNYYAEYTLDEDYVTVNAEFTCVPKVYRETDEAWLVARSDSYREECKFRCEWNGEVYTVDAALPLGRGYRYFFRQINEYSYQEQELTGRAGIADLDLAIRFRVGADSEKYKHMFAGGHDWLDANLKTYEFNEGIYTPLIFPKDSWGYNKIDLVLRLNGKPIWSRSCLEEVVAHCNGGCISGEPFYPEISVDLPALKDGDRLTLWVEAEYQNGMEIGYTILDELFAWERPA